MCIMLPVEGEFCSDNFNLARADFKEVPTVVLSGLVGMSSLWKRERD